MHARRALPIIRMFWLTLLRPNVPRLCFLAHPRPGLAAHARTRGD